jgi:holo-[acyl-carrier protein] synthase
VIRGIGADIVEVPRVEQILQRHGERFAERILAPCEWPGFKASSAPALFLAARFAAKEAFSKATGTGMRRPLYWSGIGVKSDALGKPELELTPKLSEWLRGRGVKVCHLTLTHERSLACAFVVLEGEAEQS